jgi:hypothetical protein
MNTVAACFSDQKNKPDFGLPENLMWSNFNGPRVGDKEKITMHKQAWSSLCTCFSSSSILACTCEERPLKRFYIGSVVPEKEIIVEEKPFINDDEDPSVNGATSESDQEITNGSEEDSEDESENEDSSESDGEAS